MSSQSKRTIWIFVGLSVSNLSWHESDLPRHAIYQKRI
jgi:hypothetical protein